MGWYITVLDPRPVAYLPINPKEDLLGVPDRDVWAYGEALRALRARKEFRHIEFCRLKDIVNVDVPDELDEIRCKQHSTDFSRSCDKSVQILT